MKYILLAIASLVIFSGTIAAALFLTGNFNEETLQRLIQREVVMDTNTEAAGVTDVGPVAEALRMKEQELAEREAAFAEEKRQFELRLGELQVLQTKVDQVLAEIDASMADADTARQDKIRVQATSIAAMKADKAAQLLQSFSPEEAAEILYIASGGKQVIEERPLGKILDALDTDFLTSVLRAHQDSGG